MKSLFTNVFNAAALQRFGPLASRLKSSIRQIGDGAFEIVSAEFALRIRLGKGHRKNLLVTMIPANERHDDVNDLKGEVGLSIIMEYFGHELPDSKILNPADINVEMVILSEYTEKYCFSLLLGKSNEWNEIKDFLEVKIVKSGIRGKKYKFPSNVREEWKL